MSEIIKVKATLLHEILGMASANPDLQFEHVVMKSADKERHKEEMEAMPAEDLLERATTVFPRNEKGEIILWDYQIKGTLKAALGTMVEFHPILVSRSGKILDADEEVKEEACDADPKKKEKKVKKQGIQISKWTFKRFVDHYVFITPRRVLLSMPAGASLGSCTRPLRAVTPKGERICLATSETAPEGTTLEFDVEVLEPCLALLIRKCLDYGKYMGFGQWRNSGRGSYSWEERK